nr:MAG TPA: hypothetical protein [Caudoviricetes sp.]
MSYIPCFPIKSPEAYSPGHNHYLLTLAISVWLTFMWDKQESNLHKYRPDRFSTKFTHTSPAPVLMTSILMYTQNFRSFSLSAL